MDDGSPQLEDSETITVTVLDSTDSDLDGIDDVIEDGAPNGGDGNNDGIPDRLQRSVGSLPRLGGDSANPSDFLTLVAEDGASLVDVTIDDNPDVSNSPINTNFPIGFLNFGLQDINLDGTATATLFLPTGVAVNTYYKFGPESGDPSDRFYEFLYDGSTGAKFMDTNGDGTEEIVLHFVDGERGDDDLSANGVIDDIGAPGFDTTAPTAMFANSGPVNEGSIASVSFTNPFDPSPIDTNAGFRYAYDFDNDGSFDLGDGTYSGSSSETVVALPTSLTADGPTTQTVIGRILDHNGGFTDYSTDVIVNNVAPIVSNLATDATLDNIAAENESVTLTATFSDVGLLDTHTATIDWGDGTTTTEPLAPFSDTVNSSHTYGDGGLYTVSLTLTDDDGGTTEATTTAAVSGVSLNNGVLQIIGTDGSDRVSVNRQGNTIEVWTSFDQPRRQQFTLADITSLDIRLGDGDDQATIDRRIRTSALIEGGAGRDRLTAGNGDTTLRGGAGNDRLQGRNGDDILDGGEGRDRLLGGPGKDILLGGPGNDFLAGQQGRDILIGGEGRDIVLGQSGSDISTGGTTVYDEDYALLEVIREVWGAQDSFSDRISNLTDAVDTPLVLGSAVFDDHDRDILLASQQGRDWIFAFNDLVLGANPNDQIER